MEEDDMITKIFKVTYPETHFGGFVEHESDSRINAADLQYGIKLAMHNWANVDRERIEVTECKTD
jgi:hypothetical protein